jgi:hypothetical protein
MTAAGRAIWEILHWVGEGGFMGGLNGYWDDSDGDGAIAVAGYVATEDSWKEFDPLWKAALGELPYLHMKELHQEVGAFAGWDKHNPIIQKRIADLLALLAGVIGSAKPKGFGGIVPRAGIDRFNREKGLNVSNKAVAILGAAIEMQHALNGAQVSILLDKTNDAGRSIDLAQDYFSYLYRDEPTASFPIITPIHKKSIQCAKNTPPLQAADFYAWELRKSYVNKKEFYESDGVFGRSACPSWG